MAILSLAILKTENAQNDDPFLANFIGDLEMLTSRHDASICSVRYLHAYKSIFQQKVYGSINVCDNIADRFRGYFIVIINNRTQIRFRFRAKNDASHAEKGLPNNFLMSSLAAYSGASTATR